MLFNVCIPTVGSNHFVSLFTDLPIGEYGQNNFEINLLDKSCGFCSGGQRSFGCSNSLSTWIVNLTHSTVSFDAVPVLRYLIIHLSVASPWTTATLILSGLSTFKLPFTFMTL